MPLLLLEFALLHAPLAVPFVPQQEENTCAAASLAMVLSYWGQPATETEIRQALPPDSSGVAGSALAAYARERGFQAHAYRGDLDHLKGYVERGWPLIVAWQVQRKGYHNVVVVGYADDGELIVNDPAVGALRPVSARDFEKRWSGAGHWTLLVVPK
jgi:ABC-type bacteriocin/lantibiotic exporter with double-glycine peptidase domain